MCSVVLLHTSVGLWRASAGLRRASVGLRYASDGLMRASAELLHPSVGLSRTSAQFHINCLVQNANFTKILIKKDPAHLKWTGSSFIENYILSGAFTPIKRKPLASVYLTDCINANLAFVRSGCSASNTFSAL